MADWTAVAGIATAGGTALLAVATFASKVSANRAARNSERALLEGLRPILVPSRFDDSRQKVHFVDGRWVAAQGGRATIEVTDEVIYLVMSLRNAGRGLAVLHGWDVVEDPRGPHRDPTEFHRLTRDIYAPAGDPGFCQVGLRDPTAPAFRVVADRVRDGETFCVDVLYGDPEGSQRVVTRFLLSRLGADGEWALSAGRHWNLDRPEPRS